MCYCSYYYETPTARKEHGYSEGFCGICVKCGADGHTFAHPYAAATDSWCTGCYKTLADDIDPYIAFAQKMSDKLVAAGYEPSYVPTKEVLLDRCRQNGVID
jgi:hypothetical protein